VFPPYLFASLLKLPSSISFSLLSVKLCSSVYSALLKALQQSRRKEKRKARARRRNGL